MTSTIELLETIGRDASLRHASPHDLECALAGTEASEGLKIAVASGNRDRLEQELGNRLNKSPQVNQNPHDGGCDIIENDDLDEDKPNQGDDNEDEILKPAP